MSKYGNLPPGYTICPRCKRPTPTYTGYCIHCGYPLFSTLHLQGSYTWDLYLGRDPQGVHLGLSRRDLKRSLLIYGVTGSGKTTLIIRLLHETLPYNTGFLLLDYEGEYTGWASDLKAQVLEPYNESNPLHIPLLKPPPKIPWYAHAEWAYKLLTLIIREEEWSITPQMEAVLKISIRNAVRDNAPTSMLPEYIDKAASRLPAGHQTAAALKSRLTRITDGTLTQVFNSPDTLGNPLVGRRIINLQPLAQLSNLDARIVSLAILNRIRQAILQSQLYRGPLKFLLVIEEAESLVPEGSQSHEQIIDIIAHGRKKGVGTILVTHGPLLVSQKIVNLVGNHIIHRLDSYQNAKAAANLLGDPNMIDKIRILATGEILVKAASNPYILEIKVEPLARNNDILKLINSILQYPHLTVRERRSLLGWDGSRYRQVVEEAKRRGLIEEKTFYKGTGRPIKLLQLKGMNPSAPHRYGEYYAYEILLDNFNIHPSKGYGVGPDLHFKINGKNIALEVETGANLDAGKLLGRLREHDYLVILCTSKSCLRGARNLVDRTGLRDRIIVTSLIGLKFRLQRLIQKLEYK